MKTRKLMLPMMAFICAVGMAFATAGTPSLQSTGFVEIEGSWEPVSVDCGTGDLNCQVKFSENGLPHDVYESDYSTMRKGSAEQPILINP